jgi:hypothetical protein
VVPHPGTTVLAELTEAALGHNVLFYAVQLITMALLALAANTSFRDSREEWHPRGQGQVPQAGRADPRGAAAAVLRIPAVQPARRDPGPGDQAGHGQRGGAVCATVWSSSRRAHSSFA